MGRFVAFFGPFCACHMSYLGAVEQASPFVAGDDPHGHAVNDAGDEISDVVGSGEFGKSCAEGDFPLFFCNFGGFAFLQGLLRGFRKHVVAEVDGEVSHRVGADVAAEARDDLGRRLWVGGSRFFELAKQFAVRLDCRFA